MSTPHHSRLPHHMGRSASGVDSCSALRPANTTMNEETIRRIVREELDRKPEAWHAYATAVIQKYEHEQLSRENGWNVHRQLDLEDLCLDARKKLHGGANP